MVTLCKFGQRFAENREYDFIHSGLEVLLSSRVILRLSLRA